MPSVALTSKPFMPDSAEVGTAGMVAMRCGASTASPRSLPAWMLGPVAATSVMIMSTCPPTRSAMAGPTPL